MGTSLITHIEYSPYVSRRYGERVTIVASGAANPNIAVDFRAPVAGAYDVQTSSNDGCWTELRGNFNQLIIYYNGEEYVYENTRPVEAQMPWRFTPGIYSRSGDYLQISTKVYEIVELRATLDGMRRVWTYGNGWAVE